MKHQYLTHWYKDYDTIINPSFTLPTILLFLKGKIQSTDHHIFEQASTSNTTLFTMFKDFDYRNLIRTNFDLSNLIEKEIPREYQQNKTFEATFQSGLILMTIDQRKTNNIAEAAIRVISRFRYVLEFTPPLAMYTSKLDQIIEDLQDLKRKRQADFLDPKWIAIEGTILQQLNHIDLHCSYLIASNTTIKTIDYLLLRPTPSIQQTQTPPTLATVLTELLQQQRVAPQYQNFPIMNPLQQPPQQQPHYIHEFTDNNSPTTGTILDDLDPEHVDLFHRISATFDPSYPSNDNVEEIAYTLDHKIKNITMPTNPVDIRNPFIPRNQPKTFKHWFDPLFYEGLVYHTQNDQLKQLISLIMASSALKRNSGQNSTYQQIIKDLKELLRQNPNICDNLYDTAERNKRQTTSNQQWTNYPRNYSQQPRQPPYQPRQQQQQHPITNQQPRLQSQQHQQPLQNQKQQPSQQQQRTTRLPIHHLNALQEIINEQQQQEDYQHNQNCIDIQQQEILQPQSNNNNDINPLNN